MRFHWLGGIQTSAQDNTFKPTTNSHQIVVWMASNLPTITLPQFQQVPQMPQLQITPRYLKIHSKVSRSLANQSMVFMESLIWDKSGSMAYMPRTGAASVARAWLFLKQTQPQHGDGGMSRTDSRTCWHIQYLGVAAAASRAAPHPHDQNSTGIQQMPQMEKRLAIRTWTTRVIHKL